MEVFDVVVAQRLALEIYESINNDDPLTIESASVTVAALDALKSDVSSMLETAKERLLALMDESPEYEHNGIRYERKTGSPRKSWNHVALGREVTDRLIDSATDMDTGEIMATPRELMADLLNYAGISYWRVTELNKLGINADMYCEVGEPKSNIIMKRK